jgi:uncharacterized membrane protein YdjX (TVP38/TMEM64 family)
VQQGEEPDHEEHLIEPPPRLAILAGLALVAALVVLVLTVHPLRDAAGEALSGDTEALREDLNALGFGGVLLVLGLAAVHAIVWYPAEILNAAAGFVYGFWPALGLVMVGWMINGVICHQVGRHAARPALNRFLGDDRLYRWEQAVERGGVVLLLAIRLVPVIPFSAISYVAGSARVPLWRFIWTTFVGYIPLTALFVYLGTKLEELSPTDPALWVGAALLLFLLWTTKKVVPMFGAEKEEPEPSLDK